MLISVHPRILGVSKYLVYDSELSSYSWSNISPTDAWVFGDCAVTKSLDVIMKLYDHPVPEMGNQAHVKAFRILLGEDAPKLPWHKVLPSHCFQEMIRTLVTGLTQALESFTRCSYGETFIAHRAFLLGLSRAHVDITKLSKYLKSEDNPTVSKILSSFNPGSNDTAESVRYNQVATTTGRLTVKSGPMILTLPKKYKDLITSEHEGGEIIQLDFVSLEPRVARLVAGFDPGDDVYNNVSKELFQGRLSREQAKLAVLCALYGVSERRLQGMLGTDLNSGQVIRGVKKYFGVIKLVHDLKQSLSNNGYMTNLFGRTLVPDRTDENILVSHYIQSSATDAALVGFGNVTNKLVGTGIKSLFVIHDALLLDVPPSNHSMIRDIANEGLTIEGVGNFPLALKVISTSGA